MVRLLCAVAAVALAVPTVATAQHSRRDNDRHDNSRHDNNRNHQSNRGSYGTYRVGHRPTTFRRMNVSTYRYPRGYNYRRWNVGAVLPSLFLSNSYFFNNYGAMGLGAPPPGYVWVRYGPDLLLVNRYNGRIADVISGAFY
jgi:Ni/Co efflux regulator RcnB